MNRTIAEKLKETAIEDIIWLVYLFIIFELFRKRLH